MTPKYATMSHVTISVTSNVLMIIVDINKNNRTTLNLFIHKATHTNILIHTKTRTHVYTYIQKKYIYKCQLLKHHKLRAYIRSCNCIKKEVPKFFQLGSPLVSRWIPSAAPSSYTQTCINSAFVSSKSNITRLNAKRYFTKANLENQFI